MIYKYHNSMVRASFLFFLVLHSSLPPQPLLHSHQITQLSLQGQQAAVN